MTSRLEKFIYFTKSIINIKTNSALITVDNTLLLDVYAGLYKPAEVTMQHELIFASLVNKPPILAYQNHGKRMRRTVSLSVSLRHKYAYLALSKLLYEVLPILSDFKTPKWRKRSFGNSYTFRIRQKFMHFDEFSDLINNQMYDSHKGIFLPLSIDIKLSNQISYTYNEIYLRLLHVPVSLYKRHPRPAYDDAIQFE